MDKITNSTITTKVLVVHMQVDETHLPIDQEEFTAINPVASDSDTLLNYIQKIYASETEVHRLFFNKQNLKVLDNIIEDIACDKNAEFILLLKREADFHSDRSKIYFRENEILIKEISELHEENNRLKKPMFKTFTNFIWRIFNA